MDNLQNTKRYRSTQLIRQLTLNWMGVGKDGSKETLKYEEAL